INYIIWENNYHFENKLRHRWAAWKGGSGLWITSLNSHSAGFYTRTRYASIYVEKKKSPH
ncbi:MAG: hypothetical protein ACYTFM_10805, partial [Planctomycetota bacterium]